MQQRLATLAVASVLLLCLASTTVSAQPNVTGWGMCHTFQSVDSPQFSPDLTRCGSDLYKTNSCCSRGSAKRAYNWIYEDDGCGIVGYACAVALSEIACAVNCATDLVVSGINYNASTPVIPGRPVISASTAAKVYAACQGYSWCGTQQQLTTECTTFAAKIIASQRKSGTATVQLSINSLPDTCVLVADLSPVAFIENIIGLYVHQDDTPGFVSTVTPVPYFNAAIGNGPATGMIGMMTILTVATILML